MIAAVSAAGLSAPSVRSSDTNEAVEADPDIGRVTASGTIPGGIPSLLHIGDSAPTRRSAAPLARNIERDTMRAAMVGKIAAEVRIPSRAPRTNESNASSRLNIMNPTATVMSGIISEAKRFICCPRADVSVC